MFRVAVGFMGLDKDTIAYGIEDELKHARERTSRKKKVVVLNISQLEI